MVLFHICMFLGFNVHISRDLLITSFNSYVYKLPIEKKLKLRLMITTLCISM
jgi:hypothetical protein